MFCKYSKFTAVLALAVLVLAGCTGANLSSAYAVVDGVEITQGDFYRHVNFLWFNPHEELSQEQRLKVLDEMIQLQVYSSAASARGYEPNAKDAKSDYESFRNQLISGDLFAGNATGYYTRMQELDLSEEWMIGVFGQFQIINAMVDDEKDNVADPSAEEIEAFYEKEKQRIFTHAEMRQVRHILITKDNFPEAIQDNIPTLSEELAQELYQRLSQGEDFVALAKEYSQDSSAINGGDIGFIEKGDVVPEFGDVAFSSDLGKVAEPVKSQFGWHVLEVTDIKEPGYHELDDSIREWISSSLYQEALEKRADNFLAELMAEAEIVNNLK